MTQQDRFVSDILVIGGGINGIGIARDAAGRGLRVALAECGDFASGTSSASSKLIHGGLRYLEQYEFSLVRESLTERRILQESAPHLVRPIPFILPHCPRLRPYRLVQLGLYLYDHLSEHPYFPSSSTLKISPDLGLKPHFHRGFCFYDCQEDDARFLISNAQQAHELGANLMPHVKVVASERLGDLWQLTLKSTMTQETWQHQTRCLINASGTQAEILTNQLIKEASPYKIRWVKGSHIVVKKFYDHPYGFVLQLPDQRILFVIPYYDNFCLIGTTDVPISNLEDGMRISPDEVNYLCHAVNQFFQHTIKQTDIIWSFSGVRALPDDGHSHASQVSRSHKISCFFSPYQAPAITVYGGKYTTYRFLAESVVNKLAPFFPSMGPSWTHLAHLPGGDIGLKEWDSWKQEAFRRYSWVSRPLLQRYLNYYGTKVDKLLEGAYHLNHLGKSIGASIFEKELSYLKEKEWAHSVEDILWRRGKLGLIATQQDIEQLSSYF